MQLLVLPLHSLSATNPRPALHKQLAGFTVRIKTFRIGKFYSRNLEKDFKMEL